VEAGSVDEGKAQADLEYESGGLTRETNWWGAFVVGLAGVILVTGIAPVMVTALGAAAIPMIIFVTLTGWILCFLLAELSAMMPERTGGAPSYVYPAVKDKWPGPVADHSNGIAAWAYWLGWFPVAPLNMILASFYLADRFNLDLTAGFTPINTFIAWWTLGIAAAGILLFFIPAYMGIRIGAGFATVLGLISMIPLTILAVLWIFTGNFDMGNVTSFEHLDGSSFFSTFSGHGWIYIFIAYSFLLTWNVIAMEAAACYIGECKDPERDAKIAMTLEGSYGLFIYTLIPVGFVAVLGAGALSNPDLVDPNTMFVTFTGTALDTSGELLNWIIAVMLIVALALSALNAIMGCGRSLHQMSVDGQFPRWFQRTNKHGVPSRAMGFNVVCSLLVILAGGAVEIYTFSNVGYTASMALVVFAYFLLKHNRPDIPRPYSLPNFMKWVALFIGAFFAIVWLLGGIFYSNIGDTSVYYFIGIGVLLMYIPLYLYRTRIEDKRMAGIDEPPGRTPTHEIHEK
jgi:amino acid transporter